jgi:hypothetical protein
LAVGKKTVGKKTIGNNKSWNNKISTAGCKLPTINILSKNLILTVESAPKSFFCHQGAKAPSFTKDKSFKDNLLVNLGVFVSSWQFHFLGLSEWIQQFKSLRK